jgi:outer membrane protein TolC
MKLTMTLTFALILGGYGALQARESDRREMDSAGSGGGFEIVAGLDDERLRGLVGDVLARNPHLAVLSATARAADQRAPQVRSLPDPSASLTFYLLQPQTRVGPQQLTAGVSQRLPWFGKLELEEQAAVLEAASAWSQVAAARFELVTKVRRLYLELQYLGRESRLLSEETTTLEHYEELAQARYASGVGIGQTVIKIQAEITRARARLLDIDRRRVPLLAEINALRDRPDGSPIEVGPLPTGEPAPLPPPADLRKTALGKRPELIEMQTLIEAAKVRIELAQKSARPDFTLGLSYSLIGRRADAAGKLDPPEGNGDDVLGVSGGINLPIRRQRIAAGIEEAVQQRLAAEQRRRVVVSGIDGELADLTRRVPLLREQLELFERILIVQAEESLRSAETAYASGSIGALDLLDAERVLFGVRLAAERARTDLLIAFAEIEGVLAAPLDEMTMNGEL